MQKTQNSNNTSATIGWHVMKFSPRAAICVQNQSRTKNCVIKGGQPTPPMYIYTPCNANMHTFALTYVIICMYIV